MVLQYLQYLDSKLLASNTERGYAGAITAFHAGFPGEMTVMAHRLTHRPAVRNSVPLGVLPMVMKALCLSPFGPMEQADRYLGYLKNLFSWWLLHQEEGR